MPEIEVSEDQLAYIEELRQDLQNRFVEDYGHVRERDAVQFLIDRYEETAEDDGAGTDGVEEGGTETAGADGPPDDGPDRLQAMMNLLDQHDDKWAESGSEEGKYVVSLPDGSEEHVRTRDDVRALLFKHYR